MASLKENMGDSAMVPYLGVNLSDLTFTEDGNETYANVDIDPQGNNNSVSVNQGFSQLKTINFTKFKLISQLLSTLSTLQKAPKYTFERKEIVEEWLMNSFVPYEESDLFALSKQCEPRTIVKS